jgi:hypothetical protein
VLVLMAAAAVGGIHYQAVVYPTDELAQAFVPTDVTIASIGLPMLLGSLWLTCRGRLLGLLLWPGALFFVLYNYLAYVFAMPLSLAFLLHLALVGLSAYALMILLASVDGEAVRLRLTGIVPDRLAAGVLGALGLLFFLRSIGVLVGAATGATPITETEAAVTLSDFLTAPAWVLCSVLLWRRQELGYVTGLGLLFQASMLFVGLILFLCLRPLMTATAFSAIDVIVLSIMGLTCFVPLGLYLRGVASARSVS